MSGCDIHFAFTFPPKDSTLQYKKIVYTSEMTFLALVPCSDEFLNKGVKWFVICQQKKRIFDNPDKTCKKKIFHRLIFL